ANQFSVWLMWDGAVRERGPAIPGPPGDGWSVAASAADMNADGFADVAFYNSTKQRFSIWLMRGTAVLEPGPILPGPPGDGWVIVSTADFNFDGLQDVLWFNINTRHLAVWLMRGTDVL